MHITKIIWGLSLLLSSYSYAQDQPRTKEYLHSHGIAYCLFKAEPYKEEAKIAMGGYFQIGSHDVQTADDVEQYMDQKLKEDLAGYKHACLPAYLMRCLEIAYSKEYREHIVDALEHFKDEKNKYL